MFNINNLKISGIDIFLFKDENFYLLTFRNSIYLSSLKIKYHYNERLFNSSEIEIITKLVNKRIQFDNKIEFKNINEVVIYLESFKFI
jgi:hypothetical protein